VGIVQCAKRGRVAQQTVGMFLVTFLRGTLTRMLFNIPSQFLHLDGLERGIFYVELTNSRRFDAPVWNVPITLYSFVPLMSPFLSV
jgi:hypothetical protein